MTDTEHTINTDSSQQTQHQSEEIKDAEKNIRPEYTGDKGDYPFHFERDTPIEKKPVATFSYGSRVRI